MAKFILQLLLIVLKLGLLLSFPTFEPTRIVRVVPTTHPTPIATYSSSTQNPSGQPSKQPTGAPTAVEKAGTSSAPSGQPSRRPSGEPIKLNTQYPSGQPSGQPSRQPSRQPSGKPMKGLTAAPSDSKSIRHPSGQPSRQPSGKSMKGLTAAPSDSKSIRHPSGQPSRQPSGTPSAEAHAPSTLSPAFDPTAYPTEEHIVPTAIPTHIPTTANYTPSNVPTQQPSPKPTPVPSTKSPSTSPVRKPTFASSAVPTFTPSGRNVSSNAPSPILTHSPASSKSASPTMNTSYYAYIVEEAGASKPVILDGVTRFITPPPPISGLFGSASNILSSKRHLSSRRWYLTVDVWTTGFGQSGASTPNQYVTVYAGWPDIALSTSLKGINSSMVPVVATCAPGPLCNNMWVRCQGGTNIDITNLISAKNGGSIAITSISTGVYSVDDNCKRDALKEKFVIYMKYTITPDHPQPTAKPSTISTILAPSSVGVLAQLTSTGAPFYLVSFFVILFFVLGFVLLRARRATWSSKLEAARSSDARLTYTAGGVADDRVPIAALKLMKTCFALGVSGGSIVCESVLIYVLLVVARFDGRPKYTPVWDDKMWSVGVLLLLGRVLQFIPSTYFVVKIVGFKGLCCGLWWSRSGGRENVGSSIQKKSLNNTSFSALVDTENLQFFRTLYTILIVLSFADISLVRYYPWFDSPFTRATDGLPNNTTFMLVLYWKLCQSIVALGCMLVFIDRCYRSVEDPGSIPDDNSSGHAVTTAVAFLALSIFMTMYSVVSTFSETCVRVAWNTPTALDGEGAIIVADSVNPMTNQNFAGQMLTITHKLDHKIDDLEKRLEIALSQAHSDIHLPKSNLAPVPPTATLKRLVPSVPARGSIVPGALSNMQQEQASSMLYSQGGRTPANPKTGSIAPVDSIPQHTPPPTPLSAPGGSKSRTAAGVREKHSTSMDVLESTTAPSWATDEDQGL